MEMTTTRTVTTFEMEGGSAGGKMTSSSSVTRSGGSGGGSVTRSAGAGGEVSMTIIREGQNNSGSSLEISKVGKFNNISSSCISLLFLEWKV